MKKKFFKFKSIYFKFTLIFLGIWWFLNFITFGVIIYIISTSYLVNSSIDFSRFTNKFIEIRFATKITFLTSTCLGTIIILLVMRGIVKPIKQLSAASREVAKGNFEVNVTTKSNDEVGQLTTDFNTMVNELKSIDLLRKEFVSNVSHEFRTPITSIKGIAKLLRDDKLTEEQRLEFCDIIISESSRLMDLSSNLLRLSELDSQVIREKESLFSLDEQIRKTILILEPQWTKKNIEFEIDLEETNYLGEENLLWHVWLNLIQNAIKFSYDNGLIKVLLTNQDSLIKIEITDNGKGISENDKNRIFERFYKGDTSRKQEGNGLGLVIVKKIVEQSNGKIYFESTQDKGTTFTVELVKKS